MRWYDADGQPRPYSADGRFFVNASSVTLTAPATGTPEVGGLSSWEALTLVRSLVGCSLVGADIVEVSPPYDGPGQITSLLAANLAFEILGVMALER